MSKLRFGAPLYLYHDTSRPDLGMAKIDDVDEGLQVMQRGAIGRFHLSEGIEPGTVLWSSVHAFKGLERPVVILAELGERHDSDIETYVYAGGSRARHHLIVLATEAVARELRSRARTRVVDSMRASPPLPEPSVRTKTSGRAASIQPCTRSSWPGCATISAGSPAGRVAADGAGGRDESVIGSMAPSEGDL